MYSLMVCSSNPDYGDRVRAMGTGTKAIVVLVSSLIEIGLLGSTKTGET